MFQSCETIPFQQQVPLFQKVARQPIYRSSSISVITLRNLIHPHFRPLEKQRRKEPLTDTHRGHHRMLCATMVTDYTENKQTTFPSHSLPLRPSPSPFPPLPPPLSLPPPSPSPPLPPTFLIVFITLCHHRGSLLPSSHLSQGQTIGHSLGWAKSAVQTTKWHYTLNELVLYQEY